MSVWVKLSGNIVDTTTSNPSVALDESGALKSGWVEIPGQAFGGDTYNAETGEVTPAPVEVDTSTPNLTPAQFHTMLNIGGYRADIEAYLDSLDQVTEAVFIASVRARLDYSAFFVRDDPMIISLMAVLNIDAPTMDAMWTTAASF